MKNSRQRVILEIIAKNDIETQNQLIEALSAEGVTSTQATVSRDIKELRLVKELSPRGTYRYAAPGETANHSERLQTIFRESIISYDNAQNLVVIRTLPGLADAACSAIDKMDIDELVGTIAGDDTAFIAMRTTEDAKRFCARLNDIM